MAYSEDILGDNLNKKVKRIARWAYRASPRDRTEARKKAVYRVRRAVKAPRRERVAVRAVKKRVVKRY